jgi:arginyl-tRNA synthetase
MVPQFLINAFETKLASLELRDITKRLRFEKPKNSEFGDFATNIALILAKELKQSPREVANTIIKDIELEARYIEKLNIDGPGFINIKLSNRFYTEELERIFEIGESYGRLSVGAGKKVNVEYVSANPTGLLHLGHGRNACIGDSIANLFEWMGFDVTREYYFNNAGNQMQNLGKSVYARYRQSIGDNDYPFPEDGYHGDYINEIANELIQKYADSLSAETEENIKICSKFAEVWCFDRIKQTLASLNIHLDIFFNEDSLYANGKIDEVINELRSKDLIYEKDGALWFALTKLGLTEDRVIVKSTGEPTYRLPDIAYHRDKYLRGYDIIIDVLGADHLATVPDVLAGVNALGFDPSKVKVVLHQFVTLTENGAQVKMSKRSGRSYTLDELIEEVGPDVVRFFFLMRGVSTHLEFDLNLAREQSEKNPVFYLQYAYARICSIFDTARERGVEFQLGYDCNSLNLPQEINLIKVLREFPETINLATEKLEPQILAEYLKDVATAFHSFYHDCRIIGTEEPLLSSRFKLAKVTQTVLRNGLQILGISAPERM